MTLAATDTLIEVRLTDIRDAARDTHLFEFRRMDGRPLPPSEAGAHIDVHLPNGIIRQYSLVNSGAEQKTYVVGVKRDPASRGGSSFMHDHLRVGTSLKISYPRNHFPLADDSSMDILLAGGIGITPIYCMAQRLAELGRRWQLYYACRTRADAAFAEELAAFDSVAFHFDDEKIGTFLDLPMIVNQAPRGAHLYCCGPVSMLRTFESAATKLPPEQVHVEYFAPAEEAATEGGYTIELFRSKKEFYIPQGKTILDVLREAGIKVVYSCQEGVCGSCETSVLAGEPDHRDSILDERERADSKTMMICCSGSKKSRLVLDI